MTWGMLIILQGFLAVMLASCAQTSNVVDSLTCNADACGHCPAEQTGLKICSFVATPTASESVVVINYTTAAINLNGYSLWDLNAFQNGSGQKTLNSGDVISAGSTATFTNLPFGINDSGETVYLKDSGGTVVSQKSN